MDTELTTGRMAVYKKSRNVNERRRGVTKKEREQGKPPTTLPILKKKEETPIPNARYQCNPPFDPYPKETP